MPRETSSPSSSLLREIAWLFVVVLTGIVAGIILFILLILGWMWLLLS